VKLRLHPVSEGKAGPARRPAGAMPRWVEISGAVAIIVIAVVAGLHLAGGGMRHLAHDKADPDTVPAGHDRHLP